MRTLGFAYRVLEDDAPVFEDGRIIRKDLVYLGIAAISDPCLLYTSFSLLFRRAAMPSAVMPGDVRSDHGFREMTKKELEELWTELMRLKPVSYTHLDVDKRQFHCWVSMTAFS